VDRGAPIVVTTWTGRNNRQISPEEQQLYDHLLYWIDLEPPNQMIERFRMLFLEGVGYPDAAITAALDRVTASRLAPEEFRYVLNRCCHILINRWQARSQCQWAIPELIQLFDSVATASGSVTRSRSIRRLRELIKQFTETEQYLTLRRLAQVMTQAAEAAANSGSYPLGTLIRRYPYLYEYCLLSEDSTQEQQHTVREIQAQMQRQFEIDLSQYVTYQVRRSHQNSRPLIVTPQSQRLIHPVPNPTLLSDQELCWAIRHYVGKVEGSNTYRDLAFSFIAQSGRGQSYRDFKDDLYQYITSSVQSDYGNRKFNNQLHHQLQTILPESNCQTLNDFLLVRTCSQLLNFLIVESSQRPNHFVFIDLITNLGPILTTGLLLKIVLLCRKVKPYLERRLSILFNHYETYSRDAVQWLVLALENLNVALSAHFGAVDLSFVR
jgi:hypothetical protein